MTSKHDEAELATATAAQVSSSIAIDGYSLAVVEGPDSGRRFEVVTGPRVLLGKSESCDVRLRDAEVSRRHAALDVAHGQLRVVDLDSTNGTFVEGVRVTGAWLREAQHLRVGSTTLVVQPTAVAPTPLSTARGFGRVVGQSTAMRRCYPLFERLAASDVPLVIEGETGTGKEVLAESLHALGPRARGPFVVLDCTAIPPNLMESEIFGHERGAFTGAVASRAGAFEQADKGTLFIDEIGDLDPALQPKLLRAIERSEVRRIGSSTTLRVDVRIIAATRRDLDRAVETGQFRDDLFHRLAVARVELPPLRERWGDIPVLVQHFWTELGGAASDLPPESSHRWNDYSWPGNVRELRNAVLRRLRLGDLADASSPKSARPLPLDFIGAVVAEGGPLPVGRRRVIEEFERRYLEHVLAMHGGDTAKAAEASGIARRYFQLLRARQAK